MKTILSYISIVILLCAVASCKKETDAMILPNIAFKTGAGYTSGDANVAQNTSVLVGITASKSEPNDVLKTFDVSVSYDGGAATSVHNESLTGSDGDNFSTDYPITTRSQAGTEKYTFTIINRDGLINFVSLTLTVN